MRDIWIRIETWLAENARSVLESLNEGATDQEIGDTEAFLGITFPEDMRALFRIHNGQSLDGDGLIDA